MGHRKPAYWWSDEIASVRRSCIRSYRILKRKIRANGRDSAVSEHEIYRDNKKALDKLIRGFKERAWKELCQAVENDPWGLPYQLVAGKLVGRSSLIYSFGLGKKLDIVKVLFPHEPPIIWEDLPHTHEPPIADITTSELINAAKQLPSGEAAGPDGIISEIVSAIAKENPATLLPTFNECLSSGRFPQECKEARLVLIHKGK